MEEEEEENDCKDDKQAEGRDSDEGGEEANLHNIALTQRIILDNLCAEVFTSADAERIVLGCRDEDDADQISIMTLENLEMTQRRTEYAWA